MTLLPILLYAQLRVSLLGSPRLFEVARAGYIPFSLQPDAGGGTMETALRGFPVKGLTAETAQTIIAVAVLNSRKGAFDRDDVRFAIVTKSGHRFALDANGGVNVDGMTSHLPPATFASVVEIIAATFPKSVTGDERGESTP